MVKPLLSRSILGLLFLSALGCFSPTPLASVGETSCADSELPWFEDITDRSGIDFVHDSGPFGNYEMPQATGSGCAIFDFNGDGLLDIYLLQNAGPDSKSVNRLYRQRDDHTFEDVTAGSGLGVSGYSMGVAIGDINNDGRPDVLLTQVGGVKLFLNLGNGRFQDVTQQLGLSNPLWGTSAAFLDYDRDGWLDLVVVNYLEHYSTKLLAGSDKHNDFPGPKSYRPLCSKLFHNLGANRGANRGPNHGPNSSQPNPTTPGVSFEDVSVPSGIGRIPGPGLGVVCADFNGDGWPDIFIANDGLENRLWINQHNGTFIEEAGPRAVAATAMGKAYAGMGIAIGDTNNKGRFDLFVTHLGNETNTLWRQESPGQFVDKTYAANLFTSHWRAAGFGTLMGDFENKGSLDIAIANGRPYKGGEARDTDLGPWEVFAQRNQLFANDGAGTFRDVSLANPAFCGYWNVARGLACGDFDNDGGLDLLVTAIAGRARLFRNVYPKRGHWLKVRAFDPKLKRDAYGAEVRVRIKDRELLRLVNPAESYLSSSSPLAHFGLGEAKEFDSIRVRWPDGTEERFPGGSANRLIELHKTCNQVP